jgi:hypothetical protein
MMDNGGDLQYAEERLLEGKFLSPILGALISGATDFCNLVVNLGRFFPDGEGASCREAGQLD